MQTGFALTAFITLVLNLILPEEVEDEETPELTANEVDEQADSAEWARIQRNKEHEVENGEGSDITPAGKTA